ncbi:MAG: alpha/beta hydrolase [Candidatus Rokuibacteriota bacterium]
MTVAAAAPLRVLVWLAVAAAAFGLLTLAAFWLAVRPPRLTVPLTPDGVGLRVEDVSVRAADGVTLVGWLALRPGAPAVVLLHGYPAEKADLLPLAAVLHRRFTILLMDLRYFGGSGGRATTLGVRERGDLRAALDLLAARGAGPVGVFGFSLGGAIALTTAAEDERIGVVVAYAPFADLLTLAREVYAGFWLLREPLVQAMRLWGRLFLGADLARPSPAEAAARLAVPVLVVHSRHDEQIPFGHAERLREALASNERARVEALEAGRHGEIGLGLDERVLAFFAQHLH